VHQGERERDETERKKEREKQREKDRETEKEKEKERLEEKEKEKEKERLEEKERERERERESDRERQRLHQFGVLKKSNFEFGAILTLGKNKKETWQGQSAAVQLAVQLKALLRAIDSKAYVRKYACIDAN